MGQSFWEITLLVPFIIIILTSTFHSVNCSNEIPSNPFGEQELDRVVNLPGQSFNVDFAHYAGFVTVNEEAGRALFYWFFEAQDDPSSKPIVLWQNGGPGCSSIAFGLAEELGPFHIEKDGKTLYLNPFSWNKDKQKIDEKDHNSITVAGTWRLLLLLNISWQSRNSGAHTSESCYEILDLADKEMGNIDPYSIFTPTCTASFSLLNRLRKKPRVGTMRGSYDPCTEQHSVVYFNLPEVKSALHVPKSKALLEWDTCSDKINMNWKDCPSSVLDVYQELISSGLRIWVFSGDTDAVIPVTSTRYSIDALNLTTITPWHAWYEDGQVGGWTEEYKGLTFVTVRGAGHEVPLHRPKQALTLVKSFLAGTSMPSLTQISAI
ncbi:hypothetical protein Leryth_025552 [Lithospermum erythrorhizon]|nr:hypothetical protein Leryth_025552 [Lithospermum erythrorhizon]